MRSYTRPHRFYAGVDLHARALFLCILDREGQARFSRSRWGQPQW